MGRLMSTNDSLYHYTDISAVAEIIKSKKLWLTNIGFLNDSQEFQEGLAVVSKRADEWVFDAEPEIERFKAGLAYTRGVLQAYKEFAHSNNLYTCSFSRARNLLSQWRAYGNFVIEFSRSELEKKHALYECIYDSVDKKYHSEALIRSLVDKTSVYMKSKLDAPTDHLQTFTAGISIIKNNHFEAEHEVRIIGKSDYERSGVLHRARGDYLIPYMEIDFPIESVLAIHVGPVSNQELAGRSLESLLYACGLRNLPIVFSDIPYRS